jgi:hypothetical protein
MAKGMVGLLATIDKKKNIPASELEYSRNEMF